MVMELVELLKQARQEKEISLREISEETRIQLYYLEAIETGNFDKFPGEVYLKGALRNYAEAVGLDPEKILALYHSLKKEEEPPVEPVIIAPAKRVVRPVRGEKGPSMIYGLIVMALALLLGSYWFLEHYWPRTPEPAGNHQETPGPEEPPEPAPVKPPNGISGNQQTEPPEPSAEITIRADQSTYQETVFAVRNVESLELELNCTTRCWLSLLADGKQEFPPRNFKKGEKARAGARERIWIRLGHPPGMELKINGVTVKEIEQQRNAHSFLFILEQSSNTT